MAATASVIVSGSFSTLPTGSRQVGPLTISAAAANGQVTQVVLASGANTITVPTTPAPSGCIIVLPATNTALTTLKGVTGDTGVAIGKTGFLVLTWDSANPPSSFCLTSASAQTGLVTEVTFF
jgi:hypothetical protein